MAIQYVELKAYPEVKELIRVAFPDYRKKKAFISSFTSGKNINTYWSGGSRPQYVLIDIVTKQIKTLPNASHPYFDIAAKGLSNKETDAVKVDHVGNVTLQFLPDGIALIEAGTFCGKPAIAYVYLNENNFNKLLTSS